jgi:hypothetical protein
VYGMMSLEVLEQRRKEMVREAESHRLKKVLRAGHQRSPTVSLWASTVAWELGRTAGLLRKLFRTLKNAD